MRRYKICWNQLCAATCALLARPADRLSFQLFEALSLKSASAQSHMYHRGLDQRPTARSSVCAGTGGLHVPVWCSAGREVDKSLDVSM